MASNKLASERVVVSAPMSFAGSAQRIWKMTAVESSLKVVAIIAAILLISVVWVAVLCWYVIFGLWLVPYRLLRRSNRGRKVDALRHRESLGQLSEMQRQQQMQTALLAMQQTNLMHRQQQALMEQQNRLGAPSSQLSSTSSIPAPPLAPPAVSTRSLS